MSIGRLCRTASLLLVLPFGGLGCDSGPSTAKNEVVEVDKTADAARQKMIQDAYQNQKPGDTSAKK